MRIIVSELLLFIIIYQMLVKFQNLNMCKYTRKLTNHGHIIFTFSTPKYELFRTNIKHAYY